MRTRVGYAGGTTEAPTYRDVGDHAETVQVDFDPREITFERLLDVFWTEHDPRRRAPSTQYASILFVDGPAQQRAADASAARLARTSERPLTTRIAPLQRFWVAEDYHQKYALRRDAALLQQARRWLPDDATLRDSTLAARLNALCAGDLPFAALRRELHRLGIAVVGERSIERLEPTSAPAAAQARD